MKRLLIPVLTVLAVAACMDMDVTNENAPDRERALADPGDVEALVGSSFYRSWYRTQKTRGITLQVGANALTSSWGNFGMQDMGTQPRSAWDNSTTYSYTSFLNHPWGSLYEAISNVTDGLIAIENGQKFIDTSGDDQTGRAETYAKFIQGLAHGWLALFYDQAIIFDETVELEQGVPDLVPYTDVLDAGIGYLEESIQLAGSNTFSLPSGDGAWIWGRPLSDEDLAKWAHMLAARYIANSARTPADRAAVDWDRVVHHLDNGFDEADWRTEGVYDFDEGRFTGPQGDGDIWWWGNGLYPEGWIRAAYDLIGPADNTGAYQEWRSTPLAQRGAILIDSDDKRIINTGPTDGGKYLRYYENIPHPPERGLYFHSHYYLSRFDYHRQNWKEGTMPYFVKAEADLLRAEAHLRAGDVDDAVDLLNIARVEVGELDPIPHGISAEEAWEHLYYEKPIETAGTESGLVFWDRRGWGQLICGTPLHFPVPGGELEQLQIPNYTYGGGGEGSANESTGCMP